MTTRFTFFFLMDARPEWLRLSRKQRNDVNVRVLAPIFARYSGVKARLYDAEAFSARCFDIAVFETEDIQQYYDLIETLRDSPIYAVPYFDIVELIPAIEGGFGDFESRSR